MKTLIEKLTDDEKIAIDLLLANPGDLSEATNRLFTSLVTNKQRRTYLQSLACQLAERFLTGLPPLDYVLGGGIVTGSTILLAARPNTGRTWLTLQMLNGLGHRCLYVTGEETLAQVGATARRIDAMSDRLYVLAEARLGKIIEQARTMRAQVLAINSIQTLLCGYVDGRPGLPAQLRECTARLVDYAKATATTLWLIGGITKAGDIAGPKTIEHDVDVVLRLVPGVRFEGNERILCSSKNRFGPTNIVGYFELTASGFAPWRLDADVSLNAQEASWR